MFKPQLVLLIVLASLSHCLSAQAPAVRFGSLDMDNGLTSNSINAILQDSRGYIWFSTYYGLNRYNGHEVQSFYRQENEPFSLSDNFTTCLLEDEDGSVWVGTKYGLNRFDKDTERFNSYVNDSVGIGLINNQIGALALDPDKQLWVGTMGGGLHLFDRQTQRFSSFLQTTDDRPYINHISALISNSSNELWLGTFGDGIALFNSANRQLKHYPFPKMQVNALFDDGLGFIWIASNNMGIYRFNKSAGTYHKFVVPPSKGRDHTNIVMSLTRNSDGRLLASIDGGGVLLIDPVDLKVDEKDALSLALMDLDTKAVYTVFIDGNGLYWIGTIGKGIRSLNLELNRFSSYVHEANNPKSLSENNIISMLQDNAQRIWIGTDGGGLNRFHIDKGTFEVINTHNSGLKSNVIKQLYQDASGTIWAGTYGGGLARFTPDNQKVVSYRPAEHQNADVHISVWSLVSANNDHLWVGTLGHGLYLFDKKNGAFTHLRSIQPALSEAMNDYILSMLKSTDGTLWIGTSNGVYRWDGRSVKYKRYLFDERNNSGVGKNAALCLTESEDGTIWVGTNGGGIMLIDTAEDKVTELTTKHGLVHSQVHKIMQDKKGVMWMATQGGISKYEIQTGRFQNYDYRDGLLGSAFSTLLQLSTDQIMLGGVKGLNIFNPGVIKINNYVPKVLLTNLLINNVPVKAGDVGSPLTRHIADTETLVLNHTQNNFGLEFVAINYFTELNSYSYMLENSSDDWSESSFGRVVKYSNLKPGTYVFRVKAANNDGIWSTKETKLRIIVKAPWFKTWYAFVGYFLLLGSIIYFYIRYSIQWYDMRRRLQFEVMEREKIKELNQMRLQFFTNISHEFRTPLTLIAGPLDALKKRLSLNDEERGLFTIIHKNTNLLLRLINQVMDFRKAELGAMELSMQPCDIIAELKSHAESFAYLANERHMTFRFESDLTALHLQIDREAVEKVVYNLLSNAFKYGKENGEVVLSVSQETCPGITRNCVVIRVKDDGSGIDAVNPNEVFEQYKRFTHKREEYQTGTGIGLALSKALVEQHGGQISVVSGRDSGTTFSVFLPIISAHVSDAALPQTKQSIKFTDDGPFYEELPVRKATTTKAKEKKSYRLLVVDDHQEVVDYLVDLFEEEYEVDKAFNGLEAYNVLQTVSYDLVVSDVMMPKMNGIELCHKLKTEIQTSHIPVILLSAKSAVEDRIEGITTGADAYVPKPFNADLLHAYVTNLLRSREKLREIFTGHSIIVPSDVTSNSLDEKFISRAIELVKQNMENEQFGVNELGDLLAMSRSNLHRKLKALTNKSATDFMRTVRLKEAAALLVSNEYQISEVAYKTGFNSSSYFIKSFKKEFDMSPGQYKEVQQKWGGKSV